MSLVFRTQNNGSLYLQENQVLVWEQNGYKFGLRVFADETPENPRTAYDNIATMLCAHPRYSLGDKSNDKDCVEWVQRTLRDDISNKTLLENIKSGRIAGIDADDLTDEDGAPLDDDTLLDMLDDKIQDDIRTGLLCAGPELVWLPLWLYDHSGITMSCGDRKYPYNDRWDSGCVGFIVVTRKTMLEHFPDLTAENWHDKAVEVLKSEVTVYDAYISGEMCGFELKSIEESDYSRMSRYSDWDDEESGYGFIGANIMTNGMIDTVGNGLKEALNNQTYELKDLKTRTVMIQYFEDL